MNNTLSSTHPTASGPPILEIDFDQRPFTMAWEITRACALNCIHCRAEAQKRRHPQELSTEEGLNLIDQMVGMGRPILVITGGDPLMRKDVYQFIEYAVNSGLRVALSPSATKLVTRERLQQVHEAGIHMIHISLDGSTPEVHDAFRGFRGSYDRTIEISRDIRELGIPLQVGTTVSRYNLHDLPAIAQVVEGLGVTVWSVFFLVPTGRGRLEDMISPQEHEAVFNWLYNLSREMPFQVRTTAAQAYRRVVIQRTREAQGLPMPPEAGGMRWELTGAGYAFKEGRAPQEKGVNDGKGFCFIDHLGNVCPSGFLQVSAGNVRERSLAAIYRDSTLFRELRDVSLLKGKCGICEFKEVCGGSRARAYAVTGDYLAPDPSCPYIPSVSTASRRTLKQVM
jgi:AdoMet-dependent heme synthase